MGGGKSVVAVLQSSLISLQTMKRASHTRAKGKCLGLELVVLMLMKMDSKIVKI